MSDPSTGLPLSPRLSPSPASPPSELVSGQGTSSSGRPPRRVQWPAELPRLPRPSQTPNSMTPPPETDRQRDFVDLENGEDKNPFDVRYAVSEMGSTQSEADSDERLAEVRQQMDVWVDPGETEGLPCVGSPSDSTAGNVRKAEALVSTYSKGGVSSLRKRKGAAWFKRGRGEREGEEDDDEGDHTKPTAPVGTSGGILSALIALSQQQSSYPPSAATSPGNSTPATPTCADPSPYNSDSDDEVERERFLARQRAHRASKNAFHATSSAVAGASKTVAGAAFSLATGSRSRPIDRGLDRPFGRSHSSSNLAHHSVSRASSPSPTRALSPAHRAESSATLHTHSAPSSPPLSPFARSQSSSALHNESSSSPSPPPSPGISLPITAKGGVAHSMQRYGAQLGVEMASNRPRGAGAFAGPVTSTSNVARIAPPSPAQVAPTPTRSGHHLSRFSETQISFTSRKPVDGGGASRDQQSSDESGSVKGEEEKKDDYGPGSEPLSMTTRRQTKPGFSLHLKDLPSPSFKFSGVQSPGSRDSSPRRESPLREYFSVGHQTETAEERDRREWAKEKKKRRKAKEKRMHQQVYITLHVAAILARQEFILKMARAFMMFGAPTHRLEAQIQATARVLEINCHCIYLPSLILISFGDTETHTCDIKFLKQANGLDLGKMNAAYHIYRKVIHDKISVTDASIKLDDLLVAPPKYRVWQHLIIGGLASAFIMPSAFYGSFIDCLVAIPLGALLVLVQVVVSRNDLYSSLFEIVIACLNAILAAALASSKVFCFASIASGSVVLILPGYIVLCGSLELANRSIISGSVRMVYSILYALFLGFGLSMGSEVYQRISGGKIKGATDFTCAALREGAPWWRATIPQWFYFLTIPGFLLMLGLRNGQPFYRKETIIMLLIGGAGFSANFFSARAFPGRPDICSALGAFVTGLLGGLYAKWTRESAFIVMVVGIFVQLPSGLANGGLLKFASDSTSGSKISSFGTGLWAVESLVEVALGLTVGLFVAAAVVNAVGGGRRRGSNLSSF